MAFDCKTECPVFEACQTRTRVIDAMRVSSAAAALSPNAGAEMPMDDRPTDPVLLTLVTDPNEELYENAIIGEMEISLAQEDCPGPRRTPLAWLQEGFARSGSVWSFGFIYKGFKEAKAHVDSKRKMCSSRQARAGLRKIAVIPQPFKRPT